MDNVEAKLCIYDRRNPDFYMHNADDDRVPGAPRCFCDNCFYGRNELAIEILRLRAAVELYQQGVGSYMTRKKYNRFRMCFCDGYPFPHRAGSRGSAHVTGRRTASKYCWCQCTHPRKRLTAPF